MYVQYMCVSGSLLPVCRPLLLLTACVCAGGLLSVHWCVCMWRGKHIFACGLYVLVLILCGLEQAWGRGAGDLAQYFRGGGAWDS